LSTQVFSSPLRLPFRHAGTPFFTSTYLNHRPPFKSAASANFAIPAWDSFYVEMQEAINAQITTKARGEQPRFA
jgi:hypothetical protein